MSGDAISAKYGQHIGQRFGSLVMLGLSTRRGDGDRLLGTFRCDCGIDVDKALTRVVAGKVALHCGCLTERGLNRRHGQGGRPTYVSWLLMRRRCLNPADKDYPRYGARGIGVDALWALSFEAFFDHVGSRPEGTTLDRIDGYRGYEPGNVRWATPKEQARNRRDLTVVSTPAGVMLLVDYADLIGITKGAAHLRLKRGKLEGVSHV